MIQIRSGAAAVLAALTLVLVTLAPTPSVTALATGLAVVFLAVALASRTAVLTSVSRGTRARNAAFVRRQQRSAEPAPQHPDTAGRPRTRAPSEGSRA